MANTLEAKILISAMDRSGPAFQQAQTRMATYAANMKRQFAALGSMAKAAGAALGLAAGAFGAKAIKNAQDDARALAILERSLANAGKAAKVSLPQLEKWAAELETMTGFGDESFFKVFSFFVREAGKLPVNKYKEFAKLAADIATATESTDLADAARKLSLAMQRPEEATRLLKAIGKSLTDNEKAMIKAAGPRGGARILFGILSRAFGGIAEKAHTSQGALGRLGVEMNRLSESAGKILLPSIQPVAGEVEKIASAFQNADEPTKSLVESLTRIGAAGTVARLALGARAGGVGFAVAALTESVIYLIQNWERLEAQFKSSAYWKNYFKDIPGFAPQMFNAPKNPAGGSGVAPSTPQNRIDDAFDAFKQQSSLPGTAPGYTVPKADVAAYIRQAAAARGINPEIALAVARSEGLNNWQSTVVKNGVREPSWGPFQLYTGGGLGNKFRRQTGIDPSDPSTWKQGVNFALDEAKRGGWGPWYGARAIGVTGRRGLDMPRDPVDLARERRTDINLGKADLKVQLEVLGPGQVRRVRADGGANFNVSAGVDNSGLSSGARPGFPAVQGWF